MTDQDEPWVSPDFGDRAEPPTFRLSDVGSRPQWVCRSATRCRLWYLKCGSSWLCVGALLSVLLSQEAASSGLAGSEQKLVAWATACVFEGP